MWIIKYNMIKELIKKLRGEKPQKAYRSGWTGQNASMTSSGGGVVWTAPPYVSTTPSQEKKEDVRIEKLPIEVYKEIFTTVPSIDCTSLDKKISLVEKRIRVLHEVGADGYISNEKEALGFLKARKNYLKCKELFQWETTTDELIEKLLKTYKLASVGLNEYQRNIPAEAIDELEKYNNAYEKVRDDQIILKLIIDDKKDKEGGSSKERRKDPILLASSPFGAWWYVLGAWDKEVEIVDDLIYHKK